MYFSVTHLLVRKNICSIGDIKYLSLQNRLHFYFCLSKMNCLSHLLWCSFCCSAAVQTSTTVAVHLPAIFDFSPRFLQGVLFYYRIYTRKKIFETLCMYKISCFFFRWMLFAKNLEVAQSCDTTPFTIMLGSRRFQLRMFFVQNLRYLRIQAQAQNHSNAPCSDDRLTSFLGSNWELKIALKLYILKGLHF
jgi:hypothetical protein